MASEKVTDHALLFGAGGDDGPEIRGAEEVPGVGRPRPELLDDLARAQQHSVGFGSGLILGIGPRSAVVLRHNEGVYAAGS